ncbi:MAG: glycosyltransferase family 4 protein [Bacteroidia bacterium]
MPARNIVFLYTEIAPYFLACCKELLKRPGVKVHVIRYPVNNEAPFTFTDSGNIFLYNRKDYSYPQLQELVKSLDPSAIICSGWIDKEYLKICKEYYGKIPTVLTMDTHWRGDLKQFVAISLGPLYLLKRFSHAWVPGHIQKKYALKLGFKENQVRLGFYSADTEFFSSLYEAAKTEKKKNFPKRFIYVGRYYDFKGVINLWNSFINLQSEEPSDWELWCLGTGSLTPLLHPKIKHFGFVQPENMLEYVKNTGVFVMPSLFEPWGVVLHEFAAMGFPLVVSDKVGSAEAFLREGQNGFIFKSDTPASLKEKLKTVMQLSPEQLTLMGEESRRLALQITVQTWADTVMSFL